MAPPNTSCLSSVTQDQDNSKGERKEKRKRREKGESKGKIMTSDYGGSFNDSLSLWATQLDSELTFKESQI